MKSKRKSKQKSIELSVEQFSKFGESLFKKAHTTINKVKEGKVTITFEKNS